MFRYSIWWGIRASPVLMCIVCSRGLNCVRIVITWQIWQVKMFRSHFRLYDGCSSTRQSLGWLSTRLQRFLFFQHFHGPVKPWSLLLRLLFRLGLQSIGHLMITWRGRCTCSIFATPATWHDLNLKLACCILRGNFWPHRRWFKLGAERLSCSFFRRPFSRLLDSATTASSSWGPSFQTLLFIICGCIDSFISALVSVSISGRGGRFFYKIF